ncbi:MAG: hypothetical protein QM535_04810 [Limnohabitans sp.]|nr:hypothetical protein [Limnohabitans sp.]
MKNKVTALRLPKASLHSATLNPSKKETAEVSRYDFLPVVLINGSEEPKNAIISLDDCPQSKIEFINLGKDYDDKWRKYPVANIVIAKNSMARIPLRIKRGYDPFGLQDEDGILEFKCSNGSVKMNYIDNDDTDYDIDEDKYDLKDAAYGDELVLEIDAKSLERGTEFTVSVYASDDGDGLGTTSKRKAISGKFNVKVVENDVFLREDVERLERMIKLISTNINSKPNTGEYRVNRNYCVFATDRYIGALLNNKKDFYTYDDEQEKVSNFESLLSGTIRAENIRKKGYIFDYVLYKDNELLKPIYENIKKIDNDITYDALSINKGLLISYFNKNTLKKIGFHVFYTTYSDNFHVQTLIIDNTNPVKPKYKIVDQHGETTSNGMFSEIEEGFKNQSSWTYVNFYLNHEKKTLTKTISSLWKIQRG